MSKTFLAAALGAALIFHAFAGAADAQSFNRSPKAGDGPAYSETQIAQIMRIARPMDRLVTPEMRPQEDSSGGRINAADTDDSGRGGEAEPGNYGSSNINTIYHYSDYLVPDPKVYAPVGYFYFLQSGQWYYCAATLISRSIIVTAGHCVHSGNNLQSGWITDGFFAPAATRMATATPVKPYGQARVYTSFVWTDWYQFGQTGKGTDTGLVVLRKRPGVLKEIGSLTGYWTPCPSLCLQTYWFLSQLGYASNYYGGNQLTISQHLAVNGATWASSAAQDYVWGTGMGEGSSGGPLVANIGPLSETGVDAGQYPYRNIVFATASWRYTDDATRKIQGGSPLDGGNPALGFKALFNPACTAARSLHGAASCNLMP